MTDLESQCQTKQKVESLGWIAIPKLASLVQNIVDTSEYIEKTHQLIICTQTDVVEVFKVDAGIFS